ncbi:50S ribosomal protein L16 [Candidatus Woesearchaeota archaeon]|nr:50S ribosomal protein L16 [Candidatus Woesearchaeota archaeon]
MARLRKFVAYQRLERPYTRISKYTYKNYVRGGFPHLKLTKFEMGDSKKGFDTTLVLTACRSMNIRHNALESARMSSNRILEKTLGGNYFFKMRVYPFHVLREHSLASGAGADRLSTGMARSYGKSVSSAARVREGQVLIEVRLDQANVKLGREALERAAKKLPCACKIIVAQ